MRKHAFDPMSLIFGLLFAGIGLLVLQSDVDLWRINWSWFWPITLTLAGLAVLLSARPRRDVQPQQPEPAGDDSEPV